MDGGGWGQSKYKCLGFVLNQSGTDGRKCSKKISSRRKVGDAVRSLVSSTSLRFKVLLSVSFNI